MSNTCLIKQDQQAIDLTQEWLQNNAPDFVMETMHSLFKALNLHTHVADAHTDLHLAFADVIEDLIEDLPDDLTDDRKNNITTKIMRITNIQKAAQDLAGL